MQQALQFFQNYPVLTLWMIPGLIAFIWEHSIPRMFKEVYAEPYQRYLAHPLLPRYIPWYVMQSGFIVVSLIVALICGPLALMHMIQETTWIFIRTSVRWIIAAIFLLIAFAATAQIVEFQNGTYHGPIDLDGNVITVPETDLHNYAPYWYADIAKSDRRAALYGFDENFNMIWSHQFDGIKEQLVTYEDGYRCTTWTEANSNMGVVLFEQPAVVNGKMKYVVTAIWLGSSDGTTRTLLYNGPKLETTGKLR